MHWERKKKKKKGKQVYTTSILILRLFLFILKMFIYDDGHPGTKIFLHALIICKYVHKVELTNFENKKRGNKQ